MAYILMLTLQPTTNQIIASANSSINWTANDNFGLAQDVMIGWPFWSYLLPAVFGIVGAIAILKGE